MGRNIPVPGDHQQQLAPHPDLSLSLMVVAMAATMAMITGMCGFRKNLASSPTAKQSDDQQNSEPSSLSPENDQENMFKDQDEMLQGTNGEGASSLPLPPALQPPGDGSNLPNIKSRHGGMTKSVSTRNMNNLKSVLSTKVTRSMSTNMRHINKAAHNVAHKGHKAANNVEHMIIKPKQEDSLWQKRIILGEKCRVPVGDEDGIIYDTKGDRIPTFHKKTTSSLSKPISRTTSSVDLDVMEKEKDIGKKLEMEDAVRSILDKEKETEKKEEESR